MEKILFEVKKYKSIDGRIFNTIEECQQHEGLLNGSIAVCEECDGEGKYDTCGDGREFWTCTKCKGKGLIYKK